MNLLENSAEMQQVRENLFNLLNSKDEASVAVGVNILWNLVIPDDWVFFLFEKSKRNPSIASLLQKHFPKKEFESAYIWFSLEGDAEYVSNLHHLAETLTLHKDFVLEKFLKMRLSVYTNSPYFRGGSAADAVANFEDELCNYKYIPQDQLVAGYINGGTLNFKAKKIPYEVGNFPQIRGIITQAPIYQLPYSILKLNNLCFLNLGGVGEYSFYQLKIGNKPFEDVAKRLAPQILINLEMRYWIMDEYRFVEHSGKEITFILKELNAHEVFFKFVESVALLKQGLEKEAFIVLERLYNKQEFYQTAIGSQFYLALKPFKESEICSCFIVLYFLKNEREINKIHLMEIFELYVIHFDKQNYEYACSLACQIMSIKIPKEFYQNLFQMLYVRAYLKIQQKEDEYQAFMTDFEEVVGELWETFELGIITTNEFFNMLEDYFYRGIYGKYQIMIDFLANYKSYLPIL
jgi:hypothetical protein